MLSFVIAIQLRDIMRSLRRRNAFSLLEVIAAVVILAVVAAATVATVAPMRAKSEQKLNEQQMASLNSMSQTYYLELGTFPPNGVNSLVTGGYLSNANAAAQAQNARMRTQFAYDRATGTFTKR
jgi:prepilin-type N-terminal cleavage/methylation domain-containing protein